MSQARTPDLPDKDGVAAHRHSGTRGIAANLGHRTGPAGGILALQQAAGNRVVSRLLAQDRNDGTDRKTPVTVQRALGFELEMLALVDDNGGPAQEKIPFGKYKNLKLDVDHSSAVTTPTPNSAKQETDPTNGDGPETYDTIVEMVTPAYPPENMQQAATLLNDINDAKTFADSLNLSNRVPASQLPGITKNDITDRFYVGNPLQNQQTPAASWQATLGIRLSQIGPLFDELVSQNRFVNKHQSDEGGMQGQVAKQSMTAARNDAMSIASNAEFGRFVEELVAEQTGGKTAEQLLDDLGGILTLVSEYVRMGQHYGPSGTPKNIVSVLSRTDLSQVMMRLKNDHPDIYSKTNRDVFIDMLTDGKNGRMTGDELLRNGGNDSLTVKTFLQNVFHEIYDGVTNNFLGFLQLPEEVVNETTGEMGPVVEVRNIAKPSAADRIESDRFPTSEWAALARYFIDTVARLNTSTQTGLYGASLDAQKKYQAPTLNSTNTLDLIKNFAQTGRLRQGTQTVVKTIASVYGNGDQ